MRQRWCHEALKRCRTEDQRNYVRAMTEHMQAHGEWYIGREKRAKLIPASTSRRGRPNGSAHMSLMTMDKVERELRDLGVLAPKPAACTNGKILPDGFRCRGITVVHSAGNLIRRVLAWFSFFFGREFTRRKYKSSRSQGKRIDYSQIMGCLRSHHCNGEHYFWCPGGPMYAYEALPLNYFEVERRIAEWDKSAEMSKFEPAVTAVYTEPTGLQSEPRLARRERVDYGRYVEVAA